MTWAAAANAVNYKLSVGTTSGGSELFSGTVAGTNINLSLSPNTTYYAKVVPSNLIGDAIGCSEITFSTNTTINYCGGIISTNPTATYPISSVTFNGVTNTSAATVGSPAYEDYTSTVFNAAAGTTYNLNIIGIGLGANIFAMTTFIDWNEDGDFDDASEKYFVTPTFLTGSSTPINLTGAIAVPAGTTNGTKRMRIKYNFQGSSATVLQPSLSDPCSNITNGQVEDYSILVAPVTLAPSCATISVPVAGSTDFPSNGTMTWASVTGATGYKVYIGTTSNGTDVVNGADVTTTSYLTSLTSGVMYYAKVVPYNSVGSATGCTEVSFTAGNVVYCTATSGSATFERIGNLTFADINNSSTGTNGYENFTSITGNVIQGSTHTLTASTTGSSYSTDQLLAWIDYNQDGTFDETTEKVLVTTTSVSPWTGSITIPLTAPLGTTRMRVRLQDTTGVPANATACGSAQYGQVEDYTLDIQATLSTPSVNVTKVSVYPNPFKDVLRISDLNGVKSISINDVTGRQVKMMSPSNELEVSDLKTGLYIVNLHMEEGAIISIKTIKK